MHSSKLGQLLITYNNSDWKRFLAFIDSPYFNKNEEVAALGHYLFELQPEFNTTKEKVFAHLYPGQQFDGQRMGYLMNYLLKLAEQFLAFERFGKDEFQNSRYTLLELSEKKLQKHYTFLKRKVETTLDKKLYSTSLAMQRFLFAELEMIHFSEQKVRRFDPSMQNVYDELNNFYYLQILKYACALLSWELVVKGNFKVSSITDSLANNLIQDYSGLPVIRIYLSIYKTLKAEGADSEGYFEDLLGFINKHEKEIDKDEMTEIYTYAINYGVRKIRSGKGEFTSKVLALYRRAIDKRYLFTAGYLSHWTYTNVVKLALLQNRYEWAEDFIQDYKEYLEPKFYEDAFHFNLADLYFSRDKYNEVLGQLQHLAFSDPYYNLGSRMILIKTFYELDQMESVLAYVAAFKKFLQRNRGLSSTYQQTCLNFCNCLNKILRVNSEKKKEKLLTEIAQTTPLAERNWLLSTLKTQKIGPVSRY